jgi:hypothetical protein
MNKLTAEQVRQLKVDLSMGDHTQAQLAEKYDISRSTVSDVACGRIWKDVDDPQAPEFQTTETEDELKITYIGEKWLEADEIIKKMGLDMAVWQVEKVEQRGWEVAGKVNRGQEIDKTTGQLKWRPSAIWKTKNRYISVRLSRRAPKRVQASIQALIERVDWPDPPEYRLKGPGDCVMELSLYDLHLGKYCWGLTTGTDWDNDITVSVFKNAVTDLLNKAAIMSNHVNKVIIPLGHDFFQVDNWMGETAAGTRVDSSDDRFTKTFRMGTDAMIFAIDEALKVAEVEVLYVPGNHDPATSFYLCEVLRNRYINHRHVYVDTEVCRAHVGRKYRRFGNNLIGYIHGGSKNCPKDAHLPQLMMMERAKAYSQTVDHAWRLGHLHTKKTSIVPIGDVFNGIRVERIPSLSGTDQWHFDNGFVGNRRAAEAWIWSYEHGLWGQYPSYILEDYSVHSK